MKVLAFLKGRPFYAIIIALLILMVIELILSIWRNYRRHDVFMKAKDKSVETQKPLLVIGDPNSGFWNKNVTKGYGCGDICIDLRGCNACPDSITGDVLVELKKMPDNKYVIYESCVLEYIVDKKEIKEEINRVSGGDYYEVRINPSIFTSPLKNISFIEFGTIR